MKMIIRLIFLTLLSTAAFAQTTMHGSITVNGFLGLDPDSVYKREIVLGYNKRFQDIQTFALYQLAESADSSFNKAGWESDIRGSNRYANIHAIDTVGNFSKMEVQVNNSSAYGVADIYSPGGSSNLLLKANSYKNSSNNILALTGSTSAMVSLNADELHKTSTNTIYAFTPSIVSKVIFNSDENNQSNTAITLFCGTNTNKKVSIAITPLSTSGAHFLYTESGITKRGMEYAGTGYVTQLHSLTDKEYTDKNILNIYTVSTLPTTLPNGATALVSNGSISSGPCVAYFYSGHWYRISDNVQL